MRLTSEQKKARRHARIWGQNVAYGIHHATDGRDEYQGWTAEYWGRMAAMWAKSAVRCAFQAHPELRER
jgi:hypothetical protein